ncbi:hypothetical protein EYF80_048355 [Liparis tanakae]|uniref:Uncharacterized protein n=1 Tax=Liparis tanakae TaxID=230148 RepID=A0A4Z2FKF1_9TELE|nr:hypothetical protein EYF80_048355 [Liparis tanakae]
MQPPDPDGKVLEVEPELGPRFTKKNCYLSFINAKEQNEDVSGWVNTLNGQQELRYYFPRCSRRSPAFRRPSVAASSEPNVPAAAAGGGKGIWAGPTRQLAPGRK